jgi:hypothetical protein
MDLFGFEFKRKVLQDEIPSFAPKEQDDGAVVVAAGGGYGTYVDLDGTVRTEAELVTKYREMSLQPEVDAAVDEIVNETMTIDEKEIVNINLDNVKLSENIKKIIRDEFSHCLSILDFQKHAYEIYRRWYIDGRLYYHVLIDKANPAAGIKEVRYVDPRKIRKIREISKKRANAGDFNDVAIQKIQNEYYVYNDKGFNYGNKIVGPATGGLKIAKDSVIHVTSGLTDTQGTMVLSYMHKAIKSLNQLRTLEDALVIYRLARAPERRVWYIDVGNLPKMKAEQYLRDIMVKHKNRLIYDGNSGEVRDDRKFMTMLEDYWLPRREGGRGTEVTTLPGGQTLGQMDDVLYFQKKLYQTLNVPINRLNSDALFSIGRATEVTRDELKFARFIARLRNKFSILFTRMLEKQLVLKQIMSIEDWNNIQQDIRYDFTQDNYFNELKESEVLNNRVNVLNSIQPFAGMYYSHSWIRKNVLQQSDEEIEELDAEIAAEQQEFRWMPPEQQQMIQQQQMMQQQQQMQDQQDQQDAGSPEQQDQAEKIRQAETTIRLLKPKKKKSMQELAQYKSATQILARANQ